MRPNKAYRPVTVTIILLTILFNTILLSNVQGQLATLVTARPPSLPPNPDFDRGLLNVTYYGAIPNDGIDDTEQLQKALIDARDYYLVCYLPSGVYDISQTLYGRMLDRDSGDRQFTPTMLIGQKDGPRPVLKVKDGALPTKYPALWFYGDSNGTSWVTELGITEQPNASYHHIIKNIEIDMGNNPAGVGIHFKGAQGCSMEDIKIYSSQNIDFFAGINGGLSHAGGMFNIEIIGGQYGLYGSKSTTFSVGAGISLINQTLASIYWDTSDPLTLAGFYIEKQNGPIFKSFAGTDRLGNIRLIDGVINITNAGNHTGIDNTEDKDIYLKNVYIKGAATIVKEPSFSWATQSADSWTRIEEYSYANSISYNIIDGSALNSDEYRTKTDDVSAPDINNTLLKYTWELGTIPDFDDNDLINVVSQYGAKGNNYFDNADVLQKAIDENPGKKIYLPKGIYLIGKTVTLGKNTKFFGLSSTMTYIRPTSGFASNAVVGTPMIQTVDDAEAETYLGDMGINITGTQSKVSLLKWMAGRKSMVRRFVPFATAGSQTYQNSAVLITGNGGGRWYGLYLARLKTYTGNVNSRLLLIDGTQEPLTIFSPNPEHVLSSKWGVEIRNSKNVQLFNFKGESGSFNSGKRPILGINNSDNVSVYTVACIGGLQSGGLIEIENSENYLVTYMKTTNGSTAFSLIVDKYGAISRTIPGNKLVQLVRRGNPQLLDLGIPDPVSGIDEKLKLPGSYSVFPNPSKDHFTIKTNRNLDGKTFLKLYDTMGRLCHEKRMTCNEMRLETSGLPTGIYHLEVISGSERPDVIKLVKK